MVKHNLFVANLLLAGFMAFSLSACTDDDEKEEQKQENNNQQQNDNDQDPNKPNEGSTNTVNGVSVSGKVNSYDYVDLGLPSGTKWATINVGATKPTEVGSEFAWGHSKPETDPMSLESGCIDFGNYKWCKGEKFLQESIFVWADFTKYCTDATYGDVDFKTVLEPEDDAATVNWGGAWRMPTKQEIAELIEGCDWDWENNFNGSDMSGCIGVSKTNGNIIFFPKKDGYEGYDGNHEWTSFWSASLSEHPHFVYHFSASNTKDVMTNSYTELFALGRHQILPVRAVVK